MPGHYRFAHLREDADDGPDLVARFRDDTPWPCDVCGQYEHNAASEDRCVFCSQPRNSWLCDCGHRNPPNATECQECGTMKEVE